MNYPNSRLRRLRYNPNIRKLVEDISNDINIGKLLAEKLIKSGAIKIIKNLNIE